jgi:chemotaxis signal transduction protein
MRALVPVKLGSTWLLLESEIIREILGAEAWLPIPGARAEMPGVIAWRGRAIPIVDLAAPFALERLSAGETRPRTLIAVVEDSVVAIPVDAAREVHAFNPSELKPCNVTNLPYAVAEAELFERVLAVIDLQRFVQEIQGGGSFELSPSVGSGIHASVG